MTRLTAAAAAARSERPRQTRRRRRGRDSAAANRGADRGCCGDRRQPGAASDWRWAAADGRRNRSRRAACSRQRVGLDAAPGGPAGPASTAAGVTPTSAATWSEAVCGLASCIHCWMRPSSLSAGTSWAAIVRAWSTRRQAHRQARDSGGRGRRRRVSRARPEARRSHRPAGRRAPAQGRSRRRRAAQRPACEVSSASAFLPSAICDQRQLEHDLRLFRVNRQRVLVGRLRPTRSARRRNRRCRAAPGSRHRRESWRPRARRNRSASATSLALSASERLASRGRHPRPSLAAEAAFHFRCGGGAGRDHRRP